jgi:general secretion pathway protein M
MKAQLMLWWRERSRREQRLLLVMLALLAATLLWLGVYRPVQAMLSDARARHAVATVLLGETRARADALQALRGQDAPSLSAPLESIVTQSAVEAGFANAVVAAQGARRVSVSISSVRPAPMFALVAALEARGIVVERLSARANSDPTLAVDMVLAGGV